MPSINKEVVALNPIKTKPSEERFSCRRLSLQENRVSKTECLRRNISLELSMRDTTSNSSFEVYYRSDGSVGIPFGWESIPGTPKLKSRESPLPPLTSPPSFRSSPVSTKPAKKHHKNNIVPSLLNLKKTPLMYHSPSSSRSSSSTPSSPLSARSTPYSSPHGSKQHGIVSSPRMSFDSRFESRIEDDDDFESPVSILCFRARNRRSQGCSSSIIKLFL